MEHSKYGNTKSFKITDTVRISKTGQFCVRFSNDSPEYRTKKSRFQITLYNTVAIWKQDRPVPMAIFCAQFISSFRIGSLHSISRRFFSFKTSLDHFMYKKIILLYITSWTIKNQARNRMVTKLDHFIYKKILFIT
jgi:hypothetical protein